MTMRSSRIRAAFTAIELAAVISIVLILVSTGTIATLPMLRRATFNQSLAKIEELNAQASVLARRSANTASFYGVVIRRNGAGLEAAISFGPSATWTNRALTSTSQPLASIELGPLAMIYRGSTWATATELAPGAEIGWMYRNRTGRVASTTAVTLAPSFVGVASSSFAGAGILDATVLVDESLSLRSADQRQGYAIAVYASGIMSTCAMNGL